MSTTTSPRRTTSVDAVGAVNEPPGRRSLRSVDGILLLDKPLGVSSNHALQTVKRLFRARKAGHTGSLDPLASGMLPICLGEATKVSAWLLDADKVYRVKVCFGVRTATGDAEGEVIARGPAEVNEAGLSSALAQFRGDILQIPPMYSALKHQGTRLYAIAREGREVARAARPVTIHELVVEHEDRHEPVLRVCCSKGTYIRTLIEDLAAAAGTVGHVGELRRLRVGPFAEASMRTLAALSAAAEQGEQALNALLMPADSAVGRWPAVYLSDDDALRICRGQPVVRATSVPAGLVRLYAENGRFLGIGEQLAGDRIVSRRLMAGGESAAEGRFGL